MIPRSSPDWLRNLLSTEADNPEVLKAQRAALSRLIPLMYFILVANTWVLAATFVGRAPDWLTLYSAGALTAVCAARLRVWWRTRNASPPAERIVKEFRRTNILAALLSTTFFLWGFALFPYGDALAQGHIAFFLIISMISAMFCLIHNRLAALIISAVTIVAFGGFFSWTGVPTLVAMAINVLLVTVAAVIVILIQNRDFARMVNARTEARRRHQEQSRLLRMIDDMPVAVMTVDPASFTITYLNETSKRTLRSIEHLLPIKADDILGASIDVFHKRPEHQRRLLSDPANLPHRTRITLGPEVLDLQVSAVYDDDGGFIGPMLSWAVVTKEAEAESRIRELALFDALTGLPNRITFREELTARLAAPAGETALLLVDLDGFKFVNDTRGHQIGDTLLMQVAARLRAVCKAPQTAVGRLGGDEFAILLPDGDADQAAAVADAVIDALAEPYLVGHDSNLRISASVGVALAPRHGKDVETLLSRADIALHAAKAAGKRAFRVFASEMETRIQERVRLEADLRDALDSQDSQDSLFVFYQPIFDLRTEKLTTREALVRWRHPERGWVSPGEFVPVAEDCGLIEPLGRFVLDRACRDAAEWTDGARVAVNVSAGQLGKGAFVATVLETLADSGLPPDRLEIEITETALLDDEAKTIGELGRLREAGVRVALDDFGTGYSSLAHLRAFSFDKIKIDGSFVRDALERQDCAAVVRAVADIGGRLGVTTVAEGVETQAHLDCVAAEGCAEVQGYFCGRPAPSERDAPLIDRINRASGMATAV